MKIQFTGSSNSKQEAAERGGGVCVSHMEAFVIARLMFSDSVVFVSSPDRSPPDPVLQVG